MRVFCRMYSASVSTPESTVPPTSVAIEQDLSDAFHANLSNLFDSILGDGNKRPRTSSLSRPSEVQPEKIPRVDVPVDLTPETSITVPTISDAVASVDVLHFQLPTDQLGTPPTAHQQSAATATLLKTVTPNALPLAAPQPSVYAADPSTINQLNTYAPTTTQQSTTTTVQPASSPPSDAATTLPASAMVGPGLPTAPKQSTTSSDPSVASVMPQMVLPPPQILQPLVIMPQASPRSLTMPSSQPLVMPPTTMLSTQPLVMPQPPPQTMPLLQPLVLPPPHTLAQPSPLITQSLQTAPLATTSVTPSISTAATTSSDRAANSSTAADVIQQSKSPVVNYVPNPTNFTVTNGNRVTFYGPCPVSPIMNTAQNCQTQTQQTNCMPHTTQTTFNPSATTNSSLLSGTSNQLHPLLLVAPPEEPAPELKWYYVSRFLPSETPENLIRYILDKTNCDPSLILCQKLVRRNCNSSSFSRSN